MPISEKLQKFYDKNHFVEACNMELDKAEEGIAVMHMEIEPQHTNVYHFAHGGVLATLLDTAMGLAAAGVGRQIVTMNLNVSYIHSVSVGEKAIATAKLVHSGHNTMVADAEVRNDKGALIAKSTGTLYVVGTIEK